MRKTAILFICATFGLRAGAEALTLSQYLSQVQTQNPQGRALTENVTAMSLRVHEPEVPLMPEAYVQYGLSDDKKQQAQPTFMGTETSWERWRVGVRKQTEYGLGADLYFNTQRTKVENAAAYALPVPNYNDSTAVLQLTQSLWRNGFGESTRAEIVAKKADLEVKLLQAKFDLKNLLLSAQNAYWSLVSYNQIVKLQEENVDRAKKLRDRMTRGEKLRLFDDTEAMQAEAAFQTRELELQTSLDDRAELVRQFNTLRGLQTDDVPNVEDVPAKDLAIDANVGSQGRMSREDFEMLRAQARAAQAMAAGARSQIRPQLDVQASLATNGHDGLASRSFDAATSDRYPTWTVMVNFSVPLDWSLLSDLKHSYRASGRAAEALSQQASYSEVRAWQDLLKKQREASGRYQRAINLEKIQTDLVKKERQRLANGRTTTFEALNMEQNLALSQIQRVRAQLAFLQIQNSIKTFEVKP